MKLTQEERQRIREEGWDVTPTSVRIAYSLRGLSPFSNNASVLHFVRSKAVTHIAKHKLLATR